MLFTRPYPTPANEISRLAELKRYHVLDTEPEPVYDKLLSFATALFHTKGSLISLIDDDRQWIKAKDGFTLSQSKREDAFCNYTILSSDIMVVSNAKEDPRFFNNPMVIGPPYISFYAGAPITTPRGFNIGAICTIDTESRRGFGSEYRKQLKMLAEIATSELNRRVSEYSRRDGERHRTGMDGVLSSYGIKPTAVEVINVSSRGAMIHCKGLLLPKGEEVILSIGKIIIVATVAWKNDDAEGLAFHRDLTAAELSALTRRSKASGG